MANVFRPHEISLFGDFYPIVGPVETRNAAQFAEKITFGDVGKDSEQLQSTWVVSDQRGGLGVKDMDEKRDSDRVYWSSSWITTKGHLTLPILATDATNPTGADARILIEYDNQMYAVFGKDLRRRVEGSNSWSSTLGTLVAAPTDAIVHKSKLYFACGSDFNRYDGSTLTTGSSLGSAQKSRYFVEWDGKIYNLDDDGQMDFSIDEGVTWVTDALSTLVSGTFTSLFKYHDGSSPPQVIIYMGTKEGLYKHNNGLTAFEETELPLPFHDFNSMGTVWWREWAFVSSGMSVYQYQTSSVQATIAPMGLDRDQGVPQEYSGNILHLLAGHNFLYALIDATSGTERDIFGAVQGSGEFSGGGLWNAVIPTTAGYSWVGRWDGYGWSVVALSASTATPILTGTLATAEDKYRLWFGMDKTVYYVPLPTTLENPTEVSTSVFATSSENITPWFDHNNEVANKLATKVNGFYEGMTDDEYITLEYAVDGDDDTFTSMTNSDFPDGQIDTNGEHTFEFNDGAGEAFKSIRFRETLYRGSTNTLAPDRRWLRLSYIPLLTPKWGFEARVDCRRNYRRRTARAMEQALKAALETKEMGEFTFRDQGASETHRVRIIDMPGAEVGGRRQEGLFNVSLVAP